MLGIDPSKSTGVKLLELLLINILNVYREPFTYDISVNFIYLMKKAS